MAVYNLASKTLYVDNTTLSTFYQCPTKAVVRYGYNLKPVDYKNTPMQCGISIHKAIEAHYCGASEDDAISEWRRDYFDYAVDNVPSDDRYGLQNIEATLRAWIRRNPLHDLPYHIPDPAFVETPFDFALSPTRPDIRYVGRIDAITEPKTQQSAAIRSSRKPTRYVLDTKSTGRVDRAFEKQFIIGSQMSGYFWASQQLWPEYDIGGIYINVVATTTVPNSERRCPTHRVNYSECGWIHPAHQLLGPYFRSPGEIEEWRIDALSLASQWKEMFESQLEQRDITKIPQYGKWGYQVCTNCELLDYCRSGRPAQFDFEEEVWMPGDLAQRM